GHIPDPSGIDFELARPTPLPNSPAPSRIPTPAQDTRLPTPPSSGRLPTPPSTMAAQPEALEIEEAPRTGRTRVPPVIAPRPPPAARLAGNRDPAKEAGGKSQAASA